MRFRKFKKIIELSLFLFFRAIITSQTFPKLFGLLNLFKKWTFLLFTLKAKLVFFFFKFFPIWFFSGFVYTYDNNIRDTFNYNIFKTFLYKPFEALGFPLVFFDKLFSFSVFGPFFLITSTFFAALIFSGFFESSNFSS